MTQTPGDDDKGFKGLGKLGGTPPPEPPPAAPPTPPPAAPPIAPPRPTPASGGPMPPPATGQGGGMSGCMKVALVLVGVFVAGVIGLLAVGWYVAKEWDDGRTAAEEAAAQAEADIATAAATLEAEAEAQRLAACQADAGLRPENGEILLQNASGGGHTLRINGGPADALVKLRQNGGTALAFYVRANETAEVADIPDGTYQVMFASGSDYSRSCNEFTTDMQVSGDPDPLVFEQTQEEDGLYHQIMEYTLQRQAGGNFEPTTVDPDEFRD
jgi:hypothetical protein